MRFARRIPRGQILLKRARQLRRLLPSDSRLLNDTVEILGRRALRSAVGRHERLELANHRVANGGLLLQFDLIAVLEAIEEAVARGAEALPDRF